MLGLTRFALCISTASAKSEQQAGPCCARSSPNTHRDIPKTQHLEPEQDLREKCTGGTTKHQDNTVSTSLWLRELMKSQQMSYFKEGVTFVLLESKLKWEGNLEETGRC